MLETKFTFLRQLMRKNLRLNLRRTIVTTIGIALSSALIVCVASMISSVRQTAIESIIASEGNHHARVYTPKYFADLRAHHDLTNFYQASELGYDRVPLSAAELKTYRSHRNYLKVVGFDDFAASGIKLQSGRFPTARNELLITERMNRELDRDFAVGEELKINLGALQRVNTGDGKSFIDPTRHSNYQLTPGTETITYKIVGKIARAPYPVDGYGGESITVLTYLGAVDQAKLPSSTSQILFYRFKGQVPTPGSHESELKKHFKDISVISNQQLSALEGGALDSDAMRIIILIGAIIIAIIVATSIIVIRNGFSISLTEKTKQIGILKSLGATNRQIRRSVIYESMLMGVIGTAVGVGIGILAAAILIWITNYLLVDSVGGAFIDANNKLVFGLSAIGIASAVIISLGTVLLSALTVARRARKLTAISAIRGQRDLFVRTKDVKTPRFVNRFFSVGGVIAYKNLRRNRKKYRTTIVSLTISIAAFIGIASIVDFIYFSAESSIRHTNFNIVGHYSSVGISQDKDPRASERALIDQMTAISQQLSANDKCTISSNGDIVVSPEDYNSKFLELAKSSAPYLNKTPLSVLYTVIDDASFDQVLKSNRLPVDTAAVTFKNLVIKDADKKRRHVLPVFKGSEINYRVRRNSLHREYKDTATETIDGAPANKLPTEGLGENEDSEYRLAQESFTESRKLALQFIDTPPIGFNNHFEQNVRIFIPRRSADPRILTRSFTLLISAKNDIETMKNLNSYVKQAGIAGNWNIMNLSDFTRILNNLIFLIQIFGYGFILVITLIGLTNVFNTITTNMLLRRSDFASLQSIGMTTRDFRHLVGLETLLYGLKSLLIGLPLGIGISAGVYQLISDKVDFAYRFPWVAVIISVFALFVVIRVIMQYSVNKIKRQNVIEVIRGENI